MLHRRKFVTAAASAGVVLVAGCNGGRTMGGYAGDGEESGAVENTSTVSMVDAQFDPRNIHVDAGDTVTWTNEDSVDHTVTSASDNWENDDRVASGEETSHSFGDSGVYDVYCSIHGGSDLSGMSMKVGVGDATVESPVGGDAGGSGAGDGAGGTDGDQHGDDEEGGGMGYY